MLVGRASELEAIARVLDAARAGRGGALVVRGEAGIGKTALLSAAVDRADGMRVVSTRGVESESELPFAALVDLLRPLSRWGIDYRETLPPGQAAAIDAALGGSARRTGDPVIAYAATLSLLAAAATERPLLVVADDAHWLDASSAAALAFAGRRLGAEPVALLVSLRDDDEGSTFDPSGMPELRLTGLGREQAALLLGARMGEQLADGVVERALDATSGNPLALLELARAPELLDASDTPRAPVSAGVAVAAAFGRRADALPETTRIALLIAAAADRADMGLIRRAFRAAGAPADALAPAETAGLVRVLDGTTLEFRHPLVRSAIYHRAEPSARRHAHRVLAGAVHDDAMSAVRAWHLAAAADGPDPAVADLLQREADAAATRGAYAEAARMLRRSARLSPDGRATARRLLQAARLVQLVGATADVRRLLDEADAVSDGATRAEVQRVRGRIEARSGSTAAAAAILVAEAERVAATDPLEASLLLVEAVDPLIRSGAPEPALATAMRALELAGEDRRTVAYATLARAAALVFVGDLPQAEALVTEVADEAEIDGTVSGDPQLGAYLGMTLAFAEQQARARPLLDRLVEHGRVSGFTGTLSYPLICRAWLDRRSGRWGDAEAALLEAVELAGRDDKQVDRCWAISLLCWMDAARGRESECLERAKLQETLHRRHRLPYQLATAEASRGLLDLGLGRHAAAAERLERALALKREHRFADLTTHPFVLPDLVEASVRAGNVDRAAESLEALEQAARDVGRPNALAAAARCRGMLATDPRDADAAFEESLRLSLDDPFASARTQLCFAEHLHRRNRRGDAATRLAAAATTFQTLGAEPWEWRAAAVGNRALPSRRHDRDQLTDTELRVAALVAEGRTNSQIAEVMFYSPKTVEAQLTRAYAKLGLRNRAELTRWWLEQRPATAEPDATAHAS